MMNAENQKTILLVEDEVVTAMAKQSILEKYGNKVITANTGEEAVETAGKTPAIDLVLMDINLGAGIDGAEAAQIILRERDLPVVFLSSHSEPEMVARTEKITSYGFVVKHSSHTVLDASIKMAFKLFEAKTREKEKESQREAALKALSKSEVRFRELFNRMSSGVAVYEAVDDGGDFIINDFNLAAEKIEQVSKKDVLGRRVSEAFPGVKAFGVFQVFQRVWQTGEPEYYPENFYKNEGNSGHWRESWRESWISKLPSGEIVAIYNDISERKQAEEEIKQQLTEKEILLREVHHRIKNNIASIGGLLSLHAQAVTNPEAIAVLQDAIGRVNSMRILYDKLLLTQGYKDVSVKNYVESLTASVVALFADSAKITIDQRIADFQLDAKQLSPLGIIINELLTNIMKHAFVNRDTGLITISLTNIDKHVTLTIQDDGNGLPAGFGSNTSTGFGLMLVKMLSRQLGGSFSIKMREGTLCKIEFDI